MWKRVKAAAFVLPSPPRPLPRFSPLPAAAAAESSYKNPRHGISFHRRRIPLVVQVQPVRAVMGSPSSAAGVLFALFSVLIAPPCPCSRVAAAQAPRVPSQGLTLDGVRDALVRQEDTIVFCLVERARYPHNSLAYNPSFFGHAGSVRGTSLVEFFVRQSEENDAKVGRYQSSEEIPFFPDSLSMPLIPRNLSQVLYPKSADVNVNEDIWQMYFNKLLPLFTAEGDDGNYGATVASDLVCLQALSRRIHYGRYVAEVKFSDAPQDYTPLIHAKDRDGLMKLLTFEAVEETVKRRVAKKAMVFGQNVTVDGTTDKANENGKAEYKVDPKIVADLYGEWVMPLTKLVQVEYLLRRLS